MSDGCNCGPKRAILLSVSLSRDELPCGACGGSIAVDGIKGPREAIHLLRRWVDQAFAIEMLWFSSGEYEDWAKGELDSGKSKVNQLGRQVAQKLTPTTPTWLYSAPHAGGPGRRRQVPASLHGLQPADGIHGPDIEVRAGLREVPGGRQRRLTNC